MTTGSSAVPGPWATGNGLLRMVRAETLDEKTKHLLLHGMQNLVSALGEVMGLSNEGAEDAVH